MKAIYKKHQKRITDPPESKKFRRTRRCKRREKYKSTLNMQDTCNRRTDSLWYKIHAHPVAKVGPNLRTKNQGSAMSPVTYSLNQCRAPTLCAFWVTVRGLSHRCLVQCPSCHLPYSTWKEIEPIRNESSTNIESSVGWSCWVIKEYYYVPSKFPKK